MASSNTAGASTGTSVREAAPRASFCRRKPSCPKRSLSAISGSAASERRSRMPQRSRVASRHSDFFPRSSSFCFPPAFCFQSDRQTKLPPAEILETRLLVPMESQSRRKSRGPRARQHRDSKPRRRSHQVRGLRHDEKGCGRFWVAIQKAIPCLRDPQEPYRRQHLPRAVRKTARNPAERRAPRIPATENAGAASHPDKVLPGLSSSLARCPHGLHFRSRQKLFPVEACLRK